MKLKLTRTLFVLGVTFVMSSLLLTACGFHLRGQNRLPQELRHIYLQTPNPYSPLTIQLTQALQAAGAIIVNDPKSAPVTLQILTDDYHQNLTSISSNTQVRTYTLTYTIHFQIKDQRGRDMTKPKTVTTISTYTTSDNQLLADSNVLHTQRQQMMQNAINQLFNRLNAKNVRTALNRKK